VRLNNFDKVTHLITDATPDPEISGALAGLPLDILVAGKDEP